MAVYTVIFSFSLRVIIAFEIEGLGHTEDIAGAVCDAELAALAPLFDDSDPTLCNLNSSQIKWNTPIFHLKIPPALPVSINDFGSRPGDNIFDRPGQKCMEKFV